MRAAKLLNPLALLIPVIRSVTTFILIDAYEWCTQKPKTNTDDHKCKKKTRCIANNAQSGEQSIKTDDNNNCATTTTTSSSSTTLSCSNNASSKDLYNKNDNYYPISDHYGVAAQLTFSVSTTTDNSNDKSANISCSSINNVELTEEE